MEDEHGQTESQSQCTGAGIARHRRGPNRENAQRREEAFWMILTSKTGFYRSRSLLKRKTIVSIGSLADSD